jgi:hypothetical protein
LAVKPIETDDAFLREVDEGVRRDQAASLWRRYGAIGIIVLVLLLGALGGWLWWREDQRATAGVAGQDLLAAMAKLDVGDNAAARPVFARLAKDGPPGYRPLATMMQAADAAGSGENERSIKLLETVAADKNASQPLREAALLKAVRQGFDTLPPATVLARVKDLAVPGNPWFGIAGEMSALAHIKAGKPDLAKPLLIALVRDPSLPATSRNRAAQLALSLGVAASALQPPGTAESAAPSAAAAALAPLPEPAAAPAAAPVN